MNLPVFEEGVGKHRVTSKLYEHFTISRVINITNIRNVTSSRYGSRNLQKDSPVLQQEGCHLSPEK